MLHIQVASESLIMTWSYKNIPVIVWSLVMCGDWPGDFHYIIGEITHGWMFVSFSG